MASGDVTPDIEHEVEEPNPLLHARLEWEAANPKPETLRRVERTIVRALNAAGFGRQYQVTRHDGFEIAVDDLIIRVEHDPTAEPDAS